MTETIEEIDLVMDITAACQKAHKAGVHERRIDAIFKTMYVGKVKDDLQLVMSASLRPSDAPGEDIS